jgi:hypothetical protein
VAALVAAHEERFSEFGEPAIEQIARAREDSKEYRVYKERPRNLNRRKRRGHARRAVNADALGARIAAPPGDLQHDPGEITCRSYWSFLLESILPMPRD